MSYRRVIPRDLFNEANLLKCYGRIYINLERAELPHVELDHDGEPFNIQQDSSSGAIYVENVKLKVNGKALRLERPLNSREAWPLNLITEDDEEVTVFTSDGDFTVDLVEHLKSNAN